MFMEEVTRLIIQLTSSPEGELLIINARLTQNRFHKRYSTATKNNYPQIRHILNSIVQLNYVVSCVTFSLIRLPWLACTVICILLHLITDYITIYGDLTVKLK